MASGWKRFKRGFTKKGRRKNRLEGYNPGGIGRRAGQAGQRAKKMAMDAARGYGSKYATRKPLVRSVMKMGGSKLFPK